MNSPLNFRVSVLWGVLVSGCSAATVPLGLSECGNNTMTCCIQKFPYDPVGACGATAADIQEAIEAGVEDCLSSGYICLVEWPERAPSLFPDDTVYVRMDAINEETRRIQIKDN